MKSKNQRSSPQKSAQSPAVKKPKVSEWSQGAGHAGKVNKTTKMAAPMDETAAGATARRSLEFDTNSHDKPPGWFAEFDVRLEQHLNSKFTQISSSLNDISTKMEEQDQKISACTIKVEELAGKVKKLEDERKTLIDKIDDMENRSRRNNLVFYGVPEYNQNCSETLKDIFAFVGIDPSTIPVERCHRTPTARRDDNDKPRMIHVAFQSFTSKEMVRKKCIQKFKADVFQGKKIFVDDDFSDRVRALRRSKMETLKQLKAQNKKPFFVYPAIIKYREEAFEILHTLPESPARNALQQLVTFVTERKK